MELARMLGVTVDTAINWKRRGISLTTGNLQKGEVVLAKLKLSRMVLHVKLKAPPTGSDWSPSGPSAWQSVP
jgi:hypothetical protein